MNYLRNLGRALRGKGTSPRMAAGYDAASNKRRLALFQASHEHINSLLAGSGGTLRARSRKVVREDGWASGGIEEWVSQAVGSGIVPHPQHPDKEKRALLKDLWQRWAEEADATGCCSVYGLQALAFRSVLEGGDVFTRLRPRRLSDGLTVPLQLELLEAEHVPLEKNEQMPNGRIIRSGIEFNAINRRIAYHIYRSHPGDSTARQNPITARVAASRVLHQFFVARPGQIRGEPQTVRALIKLWQLAQYDDAELERKKLAAFMAGFITPSEGNELGLQTADSVSETGEDAVTGEAFTKLEPGSFPVIDIPGQITIAQAADVGGSYEPFNRHQLRIIARAMNLSYEQLTGDLSSVNYSSIRAGLIQFRRLCEMVRANVIIHQSCRPTWRAFVEAAVLGGEIQAEDYLKNRRDYLRVNWYAPKWEWVDPLKDAQADIAEVEGGLASRTQKVGERGRDIEELDEEIRRERGSDLLFGASETSRSAVPPSDLERQTTKGGS